MRGLQRQLQDGPVAVESLVAYLPLWYYTPDPLKSGFSSCPAYNPMPVAQTA